MERNEKLEVVLIQPRSQGLSSPPPEKSDPGNEVFNLIQHFKVLIFFIQWFRFYFLVA